MSASISEAVAAAMAENTLDTSAPLSEAVVAPVEPVTAPEPEAAADPPEAPETPPEPEVTPEPVKPKPQDRRFAVLTAKLATEAAARIAAEERTVAVEALLEAAKPAPDPAPTIASGETVEQAATRLIAQRDFDTRRTTLIAAGRKELGAEAWEEKTSFLHDAGATGNPAFMQALVELPGATKLVAHLADDPDALVALLAKPPVAMAAEMGRLAAEIGRPVVAPVPRLSNAPRPQAPVAPAAVVAEPDITDESLPMNEWVAAWDKRQAARRAARR